MFRKDVGGEEVRGKGVGSPCCNRLLQQKVLGRSFNVEQGVEGRVFQRLQVCSAVVNDEYHEWRTRSDILFSILMHI